MLPSDVTFFIQHPVRNAYVRCMESDGARVFSYMGERYEWLTAPTQGYKVQLNATGSAGGELKPYRYIYFRNEDPWIDGTVDPVKYTRLEVVFELAGIEELDDDERYMDIQRWVTSVVQDFVDLYRVIAQEPDVTRPRPEDLVQTNVFVAEEYTIGPGGAEATFHPHKPRFHFPSLEVASHGKPPLAHERVDLLAGLLRRGTRLGLFWQFLLDSKEQAHINGQYDLAIALVATAFESFLRERLVTVCEARGVATLGPKGSAKLGFREAIEKGDTRRDLLEYVRELSGQNVKATREHNAWYEKAFKLRHQILHKGERGFNSEAVRAATDATVAFMALIDRIFQPWLHQHAATTGRPIPLVGNP